jgi:hypothetical protein
VPARADARHLAEADPWGHLRKECPAFSLTIAHDPGFRGMRSGNLVASSALFSDLHSENEVILHLVDVRDHLIRQDRSCQIAHGLVHSDGDATVRVPAEPARLDVRIKLCPLPLPVSSYFVVPIQPTAFPSIGPHHVWMHLRERAVAISSVEGRIAATQQGFRVGPRARRFTLL